MPFGFHGKQLRTWQLLLVVAPHEVPPVPLEMHQLPHIVSLPCIDNWIKSNKSQKREELLHDLKSLTEVIPPDIMFNVPDVISPPLQYPAAAERLKPRI